ncbi:hypothetical protein BOX15_Mlig007094g2 [Macrostomum lignano]|uniref:Uncharacterized protein n=2 Tax=Macrostomum lignano TaxID=282301 RepID=A0A267DB01_9PLAT|nr:hypothetical protein BOX15_Mlig007094g4 [Macrostomum lignano]PAA63161.1 hypothetical protein BOX15_Mlig007094g2 [Macrostomum lignano]
MADPVRATVFGLIVIGFILSFIGLVTPFWGMGLLTRLDKQKGVLESLVNNWDNPNFIKASIWNSEDWWPEISATGKGVKGKGDLLEAKVCAIFAILTGVAALVSQGVHAFSARHRLDKLCTVMASGFQVTAGVFGGVVSGIMGGCLTNKMASNPLFRLGDSFILTVLGSILFSVCGLFTVFHFVYSFKESALDKKILLLYPELNNPQYEGTRYAEMPQDPFPTSTSIAPHLQSSQGEYTA